MRKVIAILMLLATPLLQGCAAAMIEAKAKYTETYNLSYKIEMEKVNFQREKANLKPKKILTFEEWLDTQPLSATEIKLFKKYKVFTRKDLKEQEKEKASKRKKTTRKRVDEKKAEEDLLEGS